MLWKDRIIFGPTVLVWALALTLSSCSSKEESSQKHYAQGVEFYEQGETGKARVELLNAVQLWPQMAEAYYYLGLTAKKDRDLPLFFDNMTIAARLNPQNLDAKIALAQILLSQTNYEDALIKAEDVLATDPDYYDGVLLKISALISLERLQQAQTLIEQAMQMSANNPSLFSLRAGMAELQGKRDQAVALLSEAITYSENKSQPLMQRFRMHQRFGDVEGVIADLRALSLNSPNDLSYIYSLTRMLAKQERYIESEEVLKAFIAQHPDNTEAKQFLVEMINLRDKDRAEGLIAKFIELHPSSPSFSFFRASENIKQNRSEAASKQLREIIANDVFDAKAHQHARVMLADILLRNDEEEQALQLIETNLSEDPNEEGSLLISAGIDLKNKNYDRSIISARKVLRTNSKSEKALILLGHAFLQSGSSELADDSFREALSLNPNNTKAAMPIIQRLLRNQDFIRAQSILEVLLKTSANNLSLLALSAKIKLMSGDWSGAEQILAKLKSNGAGEVDLSFLQGQIHQGQNRYQAAIDAYKQTLIIAPKHIAAMEGLGLSHLRLGKIEELLQYLADFQSTNPTQLTAYTLAARAYFSQKKYADAERELEKGLAQDKTWVEGYVSLARLHKSQNDIASAIRVYTRGLNNTEENEKLQLLLAQEYQKQNNIPAAEKIYNQLIARNASNLIAVNNYALLLTDKESNAANTQRLMQLVQQLKNTSNPAYLDTLGWIATNTGDATKGEAYLRQALEGLPKSAEIHYHLGIALMRQERTEEAKQAFNRTLTLAPKNSHWVKLIDVAMAEIGNTVGLETQ